MDQESPFLFINVSENGKSASASIGSPTGTSNVGSNSRKINKKDGKALKAPSRSPSTLQDGDDQATAPGDGSAWTFQTVDPTTPKPVKTTSQSIRAHLAKLQHRQRREKAQRNKQQAAEGLVWETETASSSLASSPVLLSSRSSSHSRLALPSPVPTSPGQVTNGDPVYQTEPPSLILNPHDPNDQLHLFARQLKTSVPIIWSCYLWQESSHGILFGAQYASFKGRGVKYLHPLILTNPAVLATTVLFVACLLRHRERKELFDVEVQNLRSTAYSLVQAALDVSGEQLSDATLLAVLKLALFEAIFGQSETSQIHMQGLSKMVALRGGLEELGMGGYLARLLLWFDANLSAANKSPRFLVARDVFDDAKADDDDLFALGVKLADQGVKWEQRADSDSNA